MSATAERMTTAEVLRKALELLGQNGENWCKGDYRVNGRICSLKAIQEASPSPQVAHGVAIDFSRKLLDGGLLWYWQDRPERTWPEVKAAFEKAIELAEATQ